MPWLDEHINEFVLPHINWENPNLEPLGYFTPEEHTVIKNTWRAIKRNARQTTGRDCPILLPGRDVFIFEILARRENYPTIFIPECSRMTVRQIAKERGQSLRHCYLFDTGFAGSIPRGLAIKHFGLMSHIVRESDKQIFPRLTWSRGLALKIEQTPKYWESGRLVSSEYRTTSNASYFINTATNINSSWKDEIAQPLSHIDEFVNAARLTIEVYKNSSPRFINKHKPLSPPKELSWW